jgi:hypothetical protein
MLECSACLLHWKETNTNHGNGHPLNTHADFHFAINAVIF